MADEAGDSPVTAAAGEEFMSDAAPTRLPSSPTRLETRIRRNTACVRCRDAKVKCLLSTVLGRPCQRCTKLEKSCVVDKGHKRTSRKSKLEELAAELQTIKAAVGAPRPGPLSLIPAGLPPVGLPPVSLPLASLSAGLPPTSLPPIRPLQLPSPHSSAPHRSPGGESFVPSGPSAFTRTPASLVGPGEAAVLTPSVRGHGSVASPADPVRPAQARALRSRVFSGEDIDFYFHKYFDHFHPYLPVIKTRDPDTVYQRGPVLFWAIIMTACRRFARDESVFDFLMESLLSEIWSAVSKPPLGLSVINALLLVATWPFPTIRFLSDPSLVFSGIAVSSAFTTGLHTGIGAHSEFYGLAHNYSGVNTSDEEAVATWAGTAVIAHRVAAYMGCPSANSLFNKTIDSLLDGSGAFRLPRYFIIQLETARFSDRVARTMSASLEEAQGVSYHLVAHLEEEYNKITRLLYPDNPDLDHFTLLSTLLEIQTYYFMPLPGYNEEILKRNVMKCYTTAEAIIEQAIRLHETTAFLHYAPEFVFRFLLGASCVILVVQLSSYGRDSVGQLDADTLVKHAIKAMGTCSIMDGDLHIRGTNMLSHYWNFRAHLAHFDSPGKLGISMFKNRLGASLTFDCLRRWKMEVEKARNANAANAAAATAGEAEQASQPRLGPNADLSLPDPFERLDWNAFMDDFDWSFTSNYLPMSCP